MFTGLCLSRIFQNFRFFWLLAADAPLDFAHKSVFLRTSTLIVFPGAFVFAPVVCACPSVTVLTLLRLKVILLGDFPIPC